MDLMYYIVIFTLIFALFVLNYFFKGGLIFAAIIVFSLLGLIISVNSPVEIPTGVVVTSENSTTGEQIVETQYYEPQGINFALTLLFITSIFVSVILWSNEKTDDDE